MIKFRKPKSPAFNAGEVWVASGGAKVTIISVDFRDGHIFDSDVHYMQSNGVRCKKDCWNFQVRYAHSCDLKLEGL